MRISIVSETFIPQVNGVSRTLDRLVHHLTSQGDRVQVVIPRYRETAPPLPKNLEKSEWGGPSLPFYPEVRLPLVTPAGLRQTFKAFAPQLVHIATEGPLGWSALKAAHDLGVPTVSSYHTNFPQYLANYRLGFLENTAWRYLCRFHNATRITFCPTPSIRDRLAERGFRDLELWSRGVDSLQFNPLNRDEVVRRELGIDPQEKVIAYVGRLAAEKNLEMLLESWRLLPGREKYRLLLIGDGPLRPRLERCADSRVIFAGYWYGYELARLYASADLFVFPSLSDTFGNVILEAMASGLPVVAFQVPGPGDILREGETGMFAGRVDAESLARAMHSLLSRPEQLRAMGENARRYAERQNWKDILEQLRHTYQTIIAPDTP
jgi:glycosyltransferase involved in cell wall biosynthesis